MRVQVTATELCAQMLRHSSIRSKWYLSEVCLRYGEIQIIYGLGYTCICSSRYSLPCRCSNLEILFVIYNTECLACKMKAH